MKEIRKICDNNINHIRNMANLVIYDVYNEDYGRDILRRRGVCGASQKAIAMLLLNNGIEVEKYYSLDKYNPNLYPYDHTFSVYDDVIIDGAYYQCIDYFGLHKKNMPKEEILIFQHKDLEEVVDRFISLSQHAKAVRSRDIAHWTDQMLRDRFYQLRDYKNTDIYTKKEQKFSDVVQKYAKDNLSKRPKMSRQILNCLLGK
jgi:hypothetical protein